MKNCPICKSELEDNQYAPFCSKHCADVDLGNWFSGKYAIQASNLTEEELQELENLSKADEN